MEFDSGHCRPVVANIAIKLCRNAYKKSPPIPRYNVRKLEDHAVQQIYAINISNRFDVLIPHCHQTGQPLEMQLTTQRRTDELDRYRQTVSQGVDQR